MKQRTQKSPLLPHALLSLAASLITSLSLASCSMEPLESPSEVSDQASVESVSSPMDDATSLPPYSEVPAETSLPASTEMTPEDATAPDPAPADAAPQLEVATLGAGCYWCIEAVLEQLDGVESVVSGFMGGEIDNPTYAQVCSGTTGHAEVVQVTFDPKILPYKDLLDWFWKSHDPTTLNRQGADRGTQYRSAIFVHSPTQRQIAETSKKDVQPTFTDPIVTEITDASTFYKAKDEHQGYYFDNPSQGYCRMVIAPKLKKLGLKY
ncbi:Peptide methionine sulfoxide reductase MsrA [Planctomycetes bacterium Poly30]|uniref:Peptide methionine sulfoxide reductase MsrA n=1 Tax=Saltatorellus ferox TaxID=2528018 RepID=A0A518ET63_9BACT|nr:Peptide methionine sulfoxide reductase MsrA [Planctomycetes bacterium Poly30]